LPPRTRVITTTTHLLCSALFWSVSSAVTETFLKRYMKRYTKRYLERFAVVARERALLEWRFHARASPPQPALL
jgi:hypothetical protein